MKKTIIALCCFLLLGYTSLWAFSAGFLGSGQTVAGGGEVEPDWETDYEGVNSDCTALFTAVSGTIDCDDSAHDQSPTDDMKCTSGAKSGGEQQFGGAQTVVWFETYVYVDEAITHSTLDFYYYWRNTRCCWGNVHYS